MTMHRMLEVTEEEAQARETTPEAYIYTVMCQARETTHASSLRPRWVAWRAPIPWAWLFLPALSRCSRPSKLEVFGQYIPGDYYYVVYCLSCKFWS